MDPFPGVVLDTQLIVGIFSQNASTRKKTSSLFNLCAFSFRRHLWCWLLVKLMIGFHTMSLMLTIFMARKCEDASSTRRDHLKVALMQPL